VLQCKPLRVVGWCCSANLCGWWVVPLRVVGQVIGFSKVHMCAADKDPDLSALPLD
jgi:hypothetical protein